MFRVVKTFQDLQDTKATKGGNIYHKYAIGDKYPRDGYKPSDLRIEELSSALNAQGEPLIVDEGIAETDPTAQKAIQKRKR